MHRSLRLRVFDLRHKRGAGSPQPDVSAWNRCWYTTLLLSSAGIGLRSMGLEVCVQQVVATPASAGPFVSYNISAQTALLRDNHDHSSPKLSRTIFLHRRRNSFGSSLHILAASTFAGLSSLGEDSMEITLRRMVSGLCTGDHRSLADS